MQGVVTDRNLVDLTPEVEITTRIQDDGSVPAVTFHCQSDELLRQLKPQAQNLRHGLHVGQLCIPPIFDIAYGGRVGNTGEFGDSVPGQPPGLASGAELSGDARWSRLVSSILDGGEFFHDFLSDIPMPFSLPRRGGPHDPLEVFLCHS
jgi:hypothetical protein